MGVMAVRKEVRDNREGGGCEGKGLKVIERELEKLGGREELEENL